MCLEIIANFIALYKELFEHGYISGNNEHDL